MDVVRKNIEKLHGSVDIESKEGFGSTFTFRIPLTLAIMDAMLIRVGQSRYALPLLAVTESFRVNRNMISKTMDGLEVCKLRDDVLPVIRLHELFNIVPDSYDLEKGIMIIIESREKQVALFADEIIGQQQAVIKGLSDYIGKVAGITGCMILGDGGIGLIIDIESLIELSEKSVLVG
ncbi:MAG TPA: chemotaxis protein CheW, partial [Candidatus Kapabacteria bacterium]|nr:chemotaxis protein CheW [Candidatus Kapabacteria bacterium]